MASQNKHSSLLVCFLMVFKRSNPLKLCNMILLIGINYINRTGTLNFVFKFQ